MTAAPTDPTYPAFPLFSFLGFVLVLIPLPWHFQAWNSGTCLFMIWTSIACLNSFINSVIWADSIADVAPVWCDISTRLMVGTTVAIPAASLCINRRLYKIASCQTVSTSKAEKRRAVLTDLAIGLGIPFIQMPLQFVVQGHRYDIVENVGCFPTTYNVVPAYPLSYTWPNIINLISAIYAILTLRAFFHRRAQFAQFLATNASLTATRYFRLMALASLELLLNLPITSYGLYLSASRSRIAPWVSWATTHADFLYVGQVPAIIWRSDAHAQTTIELTRWSGVICAFAFFAFFGFAAEARKHYRLAFWALGKRFGFTPPKDNKIPSPFARWTRAGGTKEQTLPMPVSLPLSPLSQGKGKPRPDSLFSDTVAATDDGYDYARSDTSLPEKGRGAGCEYIVPSTTGAAAPPQYARCIQPGAYTHQYPSPSSASYETGSPSSSASFAETETDVESQSQGIPARPLPLALPSLSHSRPHPHRSTDDARPVTWPSLDMPVSTR